MRVYLSGFMASGKSTIGPRVAGRLGATFWDLDEMICEHEGRSVATIFSEDGEETFRALESMFLRRTTEVDPLVVALGGGALINDENRAFAAEHGLIVYLNVSADVVLDRVGGEAEERPLLQDDDGRPLSEQEMKLRIEKMMAERRPDYAEADVTVDACGSIPEVTDAVVTAVQRSRPDAN